MPHTNSLYIVALPKWCACKSCYLILMDRYKILDVDANFMVPPFQLTTFIHDLYYACDTLGYFSKATTYHIETATSVLATFFWNIFDPNRRHSISALEIKVMFLLLCKHYMNMDLSVEFYHLLQDSKTKNVSKKNFEYLVTILTKVFSYIGEEYAYGPQNKPLIMEQCFAKSHNSYDLSEDQFKNLWCGKRTRFSIFAYLMKLIRRIQDTEKLIHNNNCAACNMKVIGIRFKCRTCNNLSLCFACYARGSSVNKHEVKHRMYEVFTEDEPPKRITNFFNKICNFFRITKQGNEESRGFCNTNESTSVDDTEMEVITAENTLTTDALTTAVEVKTDAIETSIAGLSTSASTASNVSEHLQIIIARLLVQNVKLERDINFIRTATDEEVTLILESHHQFLISIINDMRRFSQISKSLSSYPKWSTPNRSNTEHRATNVPIATSDNFTTTGENLTHSINGADLNRSYLDANKSDASVNDLSTWFNQRRYSVLNTTSRASTRPGLDTLPEISRKSHLLESIDNFEIADIRDTDMMNFKILLNKVKEIVEDSFSDNTELAAATQNLESVLDSIVRNEEKRRSST
ncbi:dystrophin isoform X2 [Eurosta solidaginis]|uniref:dystrophin isoform X2 n=1 Tax=Eurosta solidaginis TaxID=178769 RepID=UPI00353136D3